MEARADADILIDRRSPMTSIRAAEGMTQIDNRDQGCCRYLWSSGGNMSGDKSSHAVADKDNPRCIDRQLGGVAAGVKPIEGGLRIFQAVRERERAGATPRTTIMDGQDIPARPAYRLCAVQILLVPGQTMKEKNGRMRAGARCSV
jgi:hypothetical protein